MDNGTNRLCIRIIGSPEVQVSGRPLTLNHLKARALFFFLAATGRSHTRDYLATLLWSEAGSSEAHHSLRSSLYRLRQALRPSQLDELILSDGDLLGLQPGAYQCDVIEFRRLLAGSDERALSRAVEYYRGPLLQGFGLSGAPVFEEWVRGEDARLSQGCFEALERLATWAEARSDWMEAIDYVGRMLQIDPLAETAQQRLMRLYLRQGEAGSALRQYRQFEAQLEQELDLSPSQETKNLLYDALQQQRSPAKITAHLSQPAPQRAYTLPLMGRDQLLHQLSDIAQDVQEGQGATVLLQGEAGIGKSRLLNELASWLISGSPPWNFLQGVCSPFDDLLSHGPFLEALQNGLQEGMADLLTESEDGGPDARGQFSWRVLQTFRSLTHSVPLLFAVEDLQWANSSTLNLFGFLSMRIQHLPVILVGTVQHAEAIPALQRLITLGRRRGELHLLSLTPLSREDVSALLNRKGIDTDSVNTLAAWLHARSSGSPFLLSEILSQLQAEGILHPDEKGWRLDTIRWLQWRTTFLLPETAHDLVAWRLTNLSLDAKRILNVLAVALQPLPVPVLCDILKNTPDSFLSLADDLIQRGLVVEVPDAMLALPHHLLRETILHQLSDLRRRAIHQKLAEALEAYAVSDIDAFLPQIALHSVAGEDVERARRYGLRVLSDLPQEYTGAETVDFVHHLYDLLAPSASYDEMVRLTRALGRLHQTLGQPDVAAHYNQQNLEWARKTGDSAAVAESYFEISELALMSNDYDGAAGAAREGLSILDAGSPAFQPSSFTGQSLIGRGHRLLGAALAMEGSDLTAAEDHLQQAVAAHGKVGNQGDLCAGQFELGNIAAQRGELQRALEFYSESAQTAETGRIHYYFALARNNFAYHSLLLGHILQAQESAAQGMKAAEAYDQVAALLHLYSTQGEIHLYLGEWMEAEDFFRRGLALAEDLGSLERQAGYRGGLALAARGQGDLDAGILLLEEALALISGQGYWHLRARLQLWLAEILFERERLTEAAQSLDEAMVIADGHHRKLLQVKGQCLRARLCAVEGEWPEANALFTEALEDASDLGLSLEIARVQAAWGAAALQYSLLPGEGRALITAAHATLAAYKALADLASLPEIQAGTGG
jgi:DNA-binding SARP family transcriptional activator